MKTPGRGYQDPTVLLIRIPGQLLGYGGQEFFLVADLFDLWADRIPKAVVPPLLLGFTPSSSLNLYLPTFLHSLLCHFICSSRDHNFPPLGVRVIHRIWWLFHYEHVALCDYLTIYLINFKPHFYMYFLEIRTLGLLVPSYLYTTDRL